MLDLSTTVQNDTNNTINVHEPNDVLQQPRTTAFNCSVNSDSLTESNGSKVVIAHTIFDAMSEPYAADDRSDDEAAFEKEFDDFNEPSYSESDESGDELSDKFDVCPPNAREELADWATMHNVAQVTISDLLSRSFKCEIEDIVSDEKHSVHVLVLPLICL